MRRTPLALLLATLIFSLSAFTNDILKKLDLAEQEANAIIFNNFQYGNLSIPYKEAIKNVAVGDRAATVKELGNYIRRYTESEAFKKAYEEARNAAMPETPSKDVATLVENRINELERDIASAKDALKKANAEMKKLYEVSLNELEKEYKALKNPKDPEHNNYKNNLIEISQEEEEDEVNADQRKQVEAALPANPKILIKKRLQEFLALTADIDFNAKLVKQGSLMKFADPKLEAKSHSWKRCYRSGKETIVAARSFAQQWLKEL